MLINNIELYVTINDIKNAKATIIITHGIAEHSKKYDDLVKEFNNSGYKVIRYDLRGHGRSGGKRGKLKSFHQNIDDLHELVLMEKKNNPKKIFLLGHSMGGGVVNMYVVKYGDVDGVISCSAATNTPDNAKILRYIGFWYLKWVSIKSSIFDKNLSRDPKVLEDKLGDEFELKKMYLSLIGQMMVKGVKYLHKNIDKYTLPVLFIHGSADKIVNPEFSKQMYNIIKSTDKEIKIYDGAYHELFKEINKKEVINDVILWLNKHNEV